MTGRSVARGVARLLTVVVLVVSGAYLILYLYRWEWNRAVISGVFFIAAEIALATTLQLDALRQRADRELAVPMTITAANAARPREPFGWLTRNDRLGVFVPVLLGAGVLLSALAYVVERVAGVFAGPPVDRHSARLVAIDLPLGSEKSPGLEARALPAVNGVRILRSLVAFAAVGLVAVAGIDQLADATQSRLVEREANTGATAVAMVVDQRRLDRPVVELAEAVWVACRSVAPPGAALEDVKRTSGNTVELLVRPALGELRRRRVFGCLEDATIERVRVDVTGWTNRSSPKNE
jgi:hypothetical protein